jgi:hypothetical protein
MAVVNALELVIASVAEPTNAAPTACITPLAVMASEAVPVN